MRFSIVWSIYRKEITEALRDRVTLLVILGLPILLYPLLITGVTKVQSSHEASEDRRSSKVAIWGAAPAALIEWLGRTNLTLEPWTGAPEGLRDRFEAGEFKPEPVGAKGAKGTKRTERTQGTNEAENDLVRAAREIVSQREIDAVLLAWPGLEAAIASKGLGHLTVYIDSVRPGSVKAGDRLEQQLGSYRAHLVKTREAEHGLAPGFSKALDTRVEDLAPLRRRAGHFIGFALPFLLITISAVGALYPAIDLTAGEKDRATMQTLLCAPVSTLEIVAGKFLTVWTISLLSALANTASLGLSLSRAAAGLGGLSLSPLTFVLAFACLLPVTCTVSALFLAVAALGRDAKDAGNFLTPTLSFLLLPMSITMAPGIELDLWTSLLPLINVALLIKALFIGEARMESMFIVLSSASVYALLALLFAARAFSREQILLGGKGALRSLFTRDLGANRRPTPVLAVTLFGIVMVAVYYGSLALEQLGILPGILITQYGCFLLPVILLGVVMRFDARETFSLRRPQWPAVLGCVLLGASASVAIAGVALRLLPPPESMAQGMEKLLLLGDTPAPLLLVWFAVAITPAVCEEAVFRGVIFAGFRRFGPWPAILISAMLFGLAHASIYRLLPTFTLGVVLGYAVWRTGSIYCGVMIHALNNGLIATLVHYQAVHQRLDLAQLTMVPWSLTLAAGAVMALGLFLLGRVRRTDNPLSRCDE